MKKLMVIALILAIGTLGWAKGGTEAPKAAETASAKQVLTRPITIVCSYAAGGGTDLVNRALAEGIKEYLGGLQVTVQNMVGAGGGVATDYVWQKPRDGTLILGLSETNLFLPGNGGHTTTTKDWEYFWAGGSPGVVMVKADSKFKTFKELVDYAKANPDKLKVAASVVPGMWSTKWFAVSGGIGIKTNVLGYTGSNPSLLATMSGEVDMLHVSAGEALSYLQSKQLRPLVATEVNDITIPGVGVVPAITKDYPELSKVLPMPQVLGLSVPADTPKPILAAIKEAFHGAMKTKPVKDILEKQVAVTLDVSGPDAKALASKLESRFNWLLVDLGKAAKNPADLGIPKP